MSHENLHIIDTDVLIIGGGLAAIMACYTCAQIGVRTIIVCKGPICSGSSFYPYTARLGCLAPRHDDPADKQYFFEEINAASLGMNNPELGRIYVEEIHDRIAELPEIGIEARLMEENRVACFAKRERALYYWEDWNKTRERVRSKLASFDNVSLVESWSALELLQKKGTVCGAIFSGPDDELLTIRASSVILATGGFGHLYKHSLNTNDICGDGHILAFSAGATLCNLEFIQFIPGYMTPRYKILFSEQSLRYCMGIRGENGKDILSDLLPESLKSEDCFLARSKHGPFTTSDVSMYFDWAIMQEILNSGKEDSVQIVFSNQLIEDKENDWYVHWMKKEMGIDLLKDKLTIAPFAHASNGGIVIDSKGQTSVSGLYAAGEVAGTMHGANRIGGCSTGNCLVFGKRAALNAAEWTLHGNHVCVDEKEIRHQISNWSLRKKAADLTAGEVVTKVQETLWYHASILRTESGLRKAISILDDVENRFDPATSLLQEPKVNVFSARNALWLARLILTAMLERKESRGSHFRLDFPEQNDALFGNPIYLKKKMQ